MRAKENKRVVVITGASSGIGRATAHAFAERGDTVVLAARRADMLREVMRECTERGGSALAVPTNLGPAYQCASTIYRSCDQSGRRRPVFHNRVEEVATRL